MNYSHTDFVIGLRYPDFVVGTAMASYEAKLRSPADIGLAIQQARLARGLTQMELADQLGISQRSISELESGKPTIWARRMFDLMRANGVELSAMWDGEARS